MYNVRKYCVEAHTGDDSSRARAARQNLLVTGNRIINRPAPPKIETNRKMEKVEKSNRKNRNCKRN